MKLRCECTGHMYGVHRTRFQTQHSESMFLVLWSLTHGLVRCAIGQLSEFSTHRACKIALAAVPPGKQYTQPSKVKIQQSVDVACPICTLFHTATIEQLALLISLVLSLVCEHKCDVVSLLTIRG